MPRTLPASRMADVATAARTVFRQKGYKRTQVADVATEVGISPAALYRHVESKEALFHLCFLAEVPDVAVQLATPAPGETIDAIKAALGGAFPSTRLRAATKVAAAGWSSADVTAELAGILEDQYRSVSDNWELLALVEASAQDLPELRDAYFRRGRRRMTALIARYLARRIDEGALVAVTDPELLAVQIRESCAWFGWHRKADPDASYDDERALASIVDLYTRALIP